jgi:hypothetical protein
MLKTWPMLKAMLWKELRDLLPVIVAAVAAQLFIVGGLLHDWRGSRWHHDRGTLELTWTFLYIIAVLFAVVCGMWQTGREAIGSHYQFLLHRPLSRHAIIGAKTSTTRSIQISTGRPGRCLQAS